MRLLTIKVIGVLRFLPGFILLGGCIIFGSSTPSSKASIFKGHYSVSFEVSSFVPCGMDRKPGYGAGYWLEADPDSRFFEQYKATISAVISDTNSLSHNQGTEVYVHFVGELSPPASTLSGGYGHLSQYPYLIRVTEVLSMSLDGRCSD
jgi:hypothetical protein